ncbi:hypothetical protein CPBF367_28760 [Xanthomonas arboricola pv. juglandis]|uniref:DUF4998 domain-containing protein n=1 Tax=Xanthomonas euroxanthea TaxID=2259622 RepID=UPI000E948F6E|nr:DUF4998 domain-containing protein [Xanthomonas euroxanthea]SYZ55696.1 hypothetical protein CPBF367_28760 [Xanthomonas arboricola pv. juglandis]
MPGETVSEPGVHLLLGIKAATLAAYLSNVVTSDTGADPVATRIAITWNPISDGGEANFAVSDRGKDVGLMSASIAQLVSGSYTLQAPAGEAGQDMPGWQLMALVKAATDAAIAQVDAG